MSELLFSNFFAGHRQRDAFRFLCAEVAGTKPGETQQLGAVLQQMIICYYQDVRQQARQSFWCALLLAVIGTGVVLWGALRVMNSSDSQPGTSWLIPLGGVIVQALSAVLFTLHGRMARQFSSFHICLERTNRYLIANSICDNIESQH